MRRHSKWEKGLEKVVERIVPKVHILYSDYSLGDIFYIAPEMSEELLPLNSRNYN